MNNERNQRKSWRVSVNFQDHYRCAIRTHNEIPSSSNLGEGMQDEDTTVWKEGERSFMEAQKGKKILFERVFSHNKKINALTEVKENQYLLLAASGIKSLQKQTAGNNCLVCIND